VETNLERIANKAEREPDLRFNSIAHHLTLQRLQKHLNKMNLKRAAGIDGECVLDARRSFDGWSGEMLRQVHHKGYKAPAVKRSYIPKPGKKEKCPLGVPTVRDSALQGATSEVLQSIYEQDFLPNSFGGRPKLSCHHALSSLRSLIKRGKYNWVLECDLKNFFGSMDHEWVMRFVSHRIGDPRILNLIKRWLKAGVFESGVKTDIEQGAPQGGPISVLLSNIYLHYVLDLWLEKIVKPKLKGDMEFVRYLDDFVVVFQYREDAELVRRELGKRLSKFSLELAEEKTSLFSFGRYSEDKCLNRESFNFLGFIIYRTKTLKGRFTIGFKIGKDRLSRIQLQLRELIHHYKHDRLQNQQKRINRFLSGVYNYYGFGGTWSCLRWIRWRAYLHWKKALSSRSQKRRMTWDKYHRVLKLYPILDGKCRILMRDLDLYVRL
jgi:RNA-directed DNA polymerase